MKKEEFIAWLEGFASASQDDNIDIIIEKAKELNLNYTPSYPQSYPVWPPNNWPYTFISVVDEFADKVSQVGWEHKDGTWSFKV